MFLLSSSDFYLNYVFFFQNIRLGILNRVHNMNTYKISNDIMLHAKFPAEFVFFPDGHRDGHIEDA